MTQPAPKSSLLAPSDGPVSAACPFCRGEHGKQIQRESGAWLTLLCRRCERRERLAIIQALYPLGSAFRAATLDFEPIAGEERALAQARRYADRPRGWYVVQGGSGNGKTMMLAGIYNVLSKRGHTCLYLSAQTIVNLCHQALNPMTDLSLQRVQRDLCAVEFLAIDELDKIDWTKTFVHNEFFEIVNRRYDAAAWTAFAFNDDSAIPAAIMSRLRDGRWGDGSGDGVMRNGAADVRPYLNSLWVDA